MSRTEEFGAESRGQMFMYLPERLTIVVDPSHPLYDPTAEDAPPPELVRSIAQEGVVTPILVRKNGMRRGKPIIEVVEGRDRVKATRLVNLDRKAAGQEPFTIPATYRRVDDAKGMDLMYLTNEQRKVEDPVTRAVKLARWLDANGQDERRARRIFRIRNSAQLRTLLSVLDMDPQLQKTLRSGAITLGIATKLTALPRARQRQALVEMLERKNGKPVRGKEAAQQADDLTRRDKPRLRSFKRVTTALDNASCMPRTPYQEGVLHALEWVMGQRTAAWAGDEK